MTTPAVRERAVEIALAGQTMRGLLHEPASPGPHPAVAVFHGFTGNRSAPDRLFVPLARRLAAAGVAALRFDFRGSGESDGLFVDMTTSAEVEDGAAALAFLRAQPGVDPRRVGVAGLSMGAMVASLLAARPGTRLSSLVLWSPAIPRSWFVHFPAGVTPDMVTEPREEGGWPIGPGFFRDLATHDPYAAVRSHRGPTLVVHGSADTLVPEPVARGYLEATNGEWLAVEGADHTFTGVRLQNRVIDATVEFLTRTL